MASHAGAGNGLGPHRSGWGRNAVGDGCRSGRRAGGNDGGQVNLDLWAAIPQLTLWQWLVGAACALAIGVAKTGVPGAAIFVVPSMILMVGDARQAAGWLLPVLCIADLFALAYWRRHADVKQLLRLAPWVAIGIALGAAALALEETILRRIVAIIILIMLALYWRGRTRPATAAASAHAWPFGITAGFATTVANAAGSVMNLYLLSMRLPKHQFLGTAAWFFFVMNLAKLPIYQWHGLFSGTSLVFGAGMIPPIAIGALAGRKLFHYIPQEIFERIVFGFTILATLALFS